MRAEVSLYLDEVRTHLHLDPNTETRVLRELYTHFEEKVSDLEDQGVNEPEATRLALSSFGDARGIARMMYEAYSRGTWTEALISCQPHLMIAVLFATHVWRHPVLLGAAFAAIVIIALLGMRRGTPPWLYSWIGYSVVPPLVLSYLGAEPVARTFTSLVAGNGVPGPLWHVAGLVALFGFTFWLLAATAVRAARRDWILVSLALLPLPVLGIWIITVGQSAGVLVQALHSLESRISRFDTAMADFFVVLGASTALFIRLRQRALKVGAVIVTGIVGGAVAANNIWADIGLARLCVLAVVLFLFLTSPLALRAMAVRPPERADSEARETPTASS